MLIALALSTGQYGHYWPSKTSIRIFLGTLFFFGLHISTAYHSYLINVLTNPRHDDQINTVERAIAAGMTFQAGENTVEFFEKEDEVRSVNVKHIVETAFISIYHLVSKGLSTFAPES
jgi:Na+/serine symporter